MSALTSISRSGLSFTALARRAPSCKDPSGAACADAASPVADEKTELSASEKKQVEDLKRQDAEVRRHEQAHLAAAGSYGQGAPHFDYKRGPDGKQYAVSGHVDIDSEKVRDDPEATLKKARVVKRAALAPKEPSAQDRKVAREAEQMAQEAQRELQKTASDDGATGDNKITGAASARYTRSYDRHGNRLTAFPIPSRINVYA